MTIARIKVFYRGRPIAGAGEVDDEWSAVRAALRCPDCGFVPDGPIEEHFCRPATAADVPLFRAYGDPVSCPEPTGGFEAGGGLPVIGDVSRFG